MTKRQPLGNLRMIPVDRIPAREILRILRSSREELFRCKLLN